MKTKFRFIFIAIVLSNLFVFGGSVWGQVPAPTSSPGVATVTRTSLDQFVGQYEDSVNLSGTIFSFFTEGDKFYMQVTNQDRIEMLRMGDT